MYKRDELKQLKKDFWIAFADYCNTIPQLSRRKSHFMLYNTRLKGAELKFDANRDGAFVILEFNSDNMDRRLLLYNHYKAYRVVIEEPFDVDLIWQENFTKPEGKIVSRIYCLLPGIDVHKREDWPAFFNFMATNMLRMERVFNSVKDTLDI